MALPLSKFIAFEIHGIQIFLLLASLQPNWIGSQKSTEPKYPGLRVLERSVLPDGGRLCALWPLVASRSLVGLLRTPQCTSHSYQLWSHGGYQGNHNLKQRKKCPKYSGTFFSSANVFAHYYCDIFPPEFPRKREQGVASPRFLLPLEWFTMVYSIWCILNCIYRGAWKRDCLCSCAKVTGSFLSTTTLAMPKRWILWPHSR